MPPLAELPKMSRADSLEVFQAGIVECQELGFQFKIAPHPDGIVVLMMGVELRDGNIVLRDESNQNLMCQSTSGT